MTAVRNRTTIGRRRPVVAAITALALVGLGVASSTAPEPSAAPAADRGRLSDKPDHATITLITGDRVDMAEVAPGRYTATAIPGSGPSSHVSFEAQGDRTGLSDLRATPEAAAALIESGQLDRGLFDLRYLATHGVTGSDARIPVTLRYSDGRGAAALRNDAARLPGTKVVEADSASGEVDVTVAAGQAAQFWAALTATTNPTASPTASPTANPTAPAGRASLAGGAAQIWLTDHQTQPVDPAPQAGQPLYTVTETIIGKTGPTHFGCLGQDLQGNAVAAGFCLSIPTPILWGIAGGGAGKGYRASRPACASQQPASPFPVCTVWQLTFTVPAGIYAAHARGKFLTEQNANHTLNRADVVLDVPQLVVADDTTITIDANRAVPVTVSTPRPAVPYGPVSYQVTRVLPDGRIFTDALEALESQGVGNWWAVPTPPSQRATVGGYHLSPELAMGSPLVTARVSGPGHLDLHPLYPCDSPTLPSGLCNVTRFTGRQTLPLVDAGQGTADEFGQIEAEGKLVLIHNCHDPSRWPRGCSNDVANVLAEQLANAQEAGAAGVLFDASTGTRYGWLNRLPAHVDSPPGKTLNDLGIRIPFIEIVDREGRALLDLLERGPVRITIEDSGTTPYAYFLWFEQEGFVPASLSYPLTDRQLAEVRSAYHYPSPPASGTQVWDSAFRPDDILAVGVALDFPGAAEIRMYYGPLSPDLVRRPAANMPFGAVSRNTTRVFDRPETITLHWNEPPVAPGALTPDTRVAQAQPGRYLNICASCRQGNTFYPWFLLINGGNPDVSLGGGPPALGSVHLVDQDGQEITPTPFNGTATYELPAQSARYRLAAEHGTTSTTWDFTSAEPKSDETPERTGCLGTLRGISTAPCRADPLIFLRYDAGLSLANVATAPGGHQLRVTAYYQAARHPKVTGLKLWTSTDGGATWWPARVTGGHDGSYTAHYVVPALASTNGHVSIKAQASDDAGNTVTQIMKDAFDLTPR